MVLSIAIIGSHHEDYFNFRLLKNVQHKDKVSFRIILFPCVREKPIFPKETSFYQAEKRFSVACIKVSKKTDQKNSSQILIICENKL